MSRQGLMDDSGYDFFDASDCANYESCREDAYNDGYEKGYSKAQDELPTSLYVDGFNDGYEKGREDAIDELSDLIDRLLWRYDEETYKDLSESFKESARLLKEQKK